MYSEGKKIEIRIEKKSKLKKTFLRIKDFPRRMWFAFAVFL